MEVTQATLSALRRELHRYPELALEEHHTAQVIERELDKAGVPHRRIGATGVLATLTGGKGPGPIVALRADIDALPMQERHETDYWTSRSPRANGGDYRRDTRSEQSRR